jgi:hypothetical protein
VARRRLNAASAGAYASATPGSLRRISRPTTRTRRGPRPSP